jgi:hypothetical protein
MTYLTKEMDKLETLILSGEVTGDFRSLAGVA